MTVLNFLKGHKCAICEERGDPLDSVPGFGIYRTTRLYFHRSCLRDVTCDPEHYKHSQVDTAIVIVEKLSTEKKKAMVRRKAFAKNCEKLSNYCVDDKTLF